MHDKSCDCARCAQRRESEFEVLEFADDAGAMPFTEAEEMELAMELMSVSSEEELDQFIRSALKRAWKGAKKIGSVVGKVAKPLGGALKGLAKKSLPFVGGALGSFIPIPGVGTAIGSALGGALSKALEIEFEGLEPDAQEFEMARRFVRIAGTAAQRAARAAPGRQVDNTVRDAVGGAVRAHIASIGRSGSGRWQRRGNTIVLSGA